MSLQTWNYKRKYTQKQREKKEMKCKNNDSKEQMLKNKKW